MKYSIMISISTKAMRDTADSVNGFMSGFGFNEKLVISSEIKFATMTASQKLPSERLDKIIDMVRDSFDKKESVLKLIGAWIREDVDNG